MIDNLFILVDGDEVDNHWFVATWSSVMGQADNAKKNAKKCDGLS